MQLIKISPSGNQIWTKYYGGSNYESARSVKLCLDGGFILAGHTALSDTSIAKIYLVKTNTIGDTLWTKTIGGSDSYDGKSILANSDGTYTLCADDSSGIHDSDVRIMNISSTGAIIWNKSFGGTSKDICKMIQHTTDGGYIIASISRSFGWINPKMWIIKLNSSGDTLWTRHFGGAGHEHCYAVKQTSDGGFITVGHTKSWSPTTEIFLVKFYVAPTSVSVSEMALINSINVYPNPSDGLVRMNFNEDFSSIPEITIYNSSGQIIYSEKTNSINNYKTFDLSVQAPGVYFINIRSNNQVSTKTIVLQ